MSVHEQSEQGSAPSGLEMVLLTFLKGLQEDSFTAPPLTLADFKVFFSLETFTLRFELSGWVGLLGKG